MYGFRLLDLQSTRIKLFIDSSGCVLMQLARFLPVGASSSFWVKKTTIHKKGKDNLYERYFV